MSIEITEERFRQILREELALHTKTQRSEYKERQSQAIAEARKRREDLKEEGEAID